MHGRWRYLIPNLVTALGMGVGLSSMAATARGELVTAGWLLIWAVLIDRIDGIVARALGAVSEFGRQMDSFADTVNFGVAPAVLIYASLRRIPELGLDAGWGHVALGGCCLAWVLACVFRLAKFNVRRDAPPRTASGKPLRLRPDAPERQVFYGLASTLAAGVLAIWYLVLHKYSAAGASFGSPEAFVCPRLLGTWTIDIHAWAAFVPAMAIGALLMAAELPTTKLVPTGSRAFNVFLLSMIVAGVACGVWRVLPEFMAVLPSIWLVLSLLWGHQTVGRRLRPADYLPADDAP